MAFSVEQLYDLQTVDWEIRKASKTLAEDRARLADRSEVDAAAANVDRLRSDLRDNRVSRRTAESTLRDLDAKIEGIGNRMYSGHVTSERQYQAMEEERSFLEDQKGAGEDRLLEFMVAIDDLEVDLVSGEESLESLTRAKNSETVRLTAEIGELEEDLADLGLRRTDLAAGVPPVALATYHSLLERRGGRAVAKLDRGMCEGCQLVLPTGEVYRARAATGLHQCSSCTRIIFVV